MHNVDVSGNVPLYGQEQCCWCGAASGQMTMDGYPDPAHRLFFTQLSVWNSIQVHNSTDPADAGWCTDPFGLRDCMMGMNPPPSGGHWVVFSESVRDQLMFWIFYWMNQNNYPVPVLINRGDHWVVIVGYQTDVAPDLGSSPVLQQIRFFDPEPHNVGTDTTQTAATWYGAPFNGAIKYSGTWYGDYVAVIEPPQGKESIRVRMEKRVGDKIISPKNALEYAQRWIEELNLAERYPILRHAELRNAQPLVVREEIRLGQKLKKVPYYYIVPFGLPREVADNDSPLIRAVVIVNAFTGKFEEVTAFGKPMPFVSENRARNVVARALNLTAAQTRRATAELVFTPSDITHVRVYPFWKVTAGERSVYIDQLGTIYGKLKPSIAGD